MIETTSSFGIEIRSGVSARVLLEVPMSIIPTQNIWFDDAATSAMGEAFDEACKLLQDFGSAPEIVANRIIATAKDGERDFVRLYEEALKAFGVEDISTQAVGVARDLPTSIPV